MTRASQGVGWGSWGNTRLCRALTPASLSRLWDGKPLYPQQDTVCSP